MANEEVAFQLYKNRDHVRMAPERVIAQQKTELMRLQNLLVAAIEDNLIISSDESDDDFKERDKLDNMRNRNSIKNLSSSRASKASGFVAKSPKETDVSEIMKPFKTDKQLEIEVEQMIQVKKMSYSSFLAEPLLSKYYRIRRRHLDSIDELIKNQLLNTKVVLPMTKSFVAKFAEDVVNFKDRGFVTYICGMFFEKTLNKVKRIKFLALKK